jgi:hypothetical protein
VQIEQFLRRLQRRALRILRPGEDVDHDPVVLMEPAHGAQPAQAARLSGRRRRNLARTIFAFMSTLAVLSAVYVVAVAANSRVRLDGAAVPSAGTGESAAVAAVIEVLAFGGGPGSEAGRELLFVPSGKAMRTVRIHEGIERVAAVWIARAGPQRGRLDDALADARTAMANGDRIAARDALLRFNNRLGRGRAELDVGPDALAGLFMAAADACESEAAALSALSGERALLASPATDGRVSEARGLAWAWLVVLRGALKDAPDLAQTLSLEASIPLDALSRAAERHPLFLFNGDPGSPWAPAHVADASAEFARAGAGARALAAAIRRVAAG